MWPNWWHFLQIWATDFFLLPTGYPNSSSLERCINLQPCPKPTYARKIKWHNCCPFILFGIIFLHWCVTCVPISSTNCINTVIYHCHAQPVAWYTEGCHRLPLISQRIIPVYGRCVYVPSWGVVATTNYIQHVICKWRVMLMTKSTYKTELFNSLHLNISMHILHTVLYTFPLVLVRRIEQSRVSLVNDHFLDSHELNVWFSRRYCRENLGVNHS